MGQSQTILNDLKLAMKAKEPIKVSVLRMLVASLKNAQIEKGKEFRESDTVKVIEKEAKKRVEAIEMYKKADRSELVEKEASELEILKTYLPKKMSKDQVVTKVKQLKEEGKLPDNFGDAMKAAMAEFKGKADGKMVAEAVKEVV